VLRGPGSMLFCYQNSFLPYPSSRATDLITGSTTPGFTVLFVVPFADLPSRSLFLDFFLYWGSTGSVSESLARSIICFPMRRAPCCEFAR